MNVSFFREIFLHAGPVLVSFVRHSPAFFFFHTLRGRINRVGHYPPRFRLFMALHLPCKSQARSLITVLEFILQDEAMKGRRAQ